SRWNCRAFETSFLFGLPEAGVCAAGSPVAPRSAIAAAVTPTWANSQALPSGGISRRRWVETFRPIVLCFRFSFSDSALELAAAPKQRCAKSDFMESERTARSPGTPTCSRNARRASLDAAPQSSSKVGAGAAVEVSVVAFLGFEVLAAINRRA